MSHKKEMSHGELKWKSKTCILHTYTTFIDSASTKIRKKFNKLKNIVILLLGDNY